MIFFALLPVFALFLVVIQISLSDLLFAGLFRFELSLVLILYAGFYLDAIRGLSMVLVFGFILDTLVGTMPLFYVLFYAVVFAGARLTSLRVYGEGRAMLMVLTFFCVAVQSIAILLLQWAGSAVFFSVATMAPVLLNAALLSVISPLLFVVFEKCEVATHVEPR